VSNLAAEINADSYWRTPFHSLSSPKQLKEYVIMDIDKDISIKPHVFGHQSHKVNNNISKTIFLLPILKPNLGETLF